MRHLLGLTEYWLEQPWVSKGSPLVTSKLSAVQISVQRDHILDYFQFLCSLGVIYFVTEVESQFQCPH